jgi:6-phosphogluconolactonase
VTETSVVVHADPDLLAQAVAARLVVKMIDAQAERGEATIVLTGGRIATAVYQAARDLPARDAVDWSRVDVWWGDERFLPSSDPERNETQAREALLDSVPLDPARVHTMPASDGPDGDDPEAAAARYAALLAGAARPGQEMPHIDVLLLGVGGEGHIASIFPESPAAYEERTVAAVRGCPKPPPTRITLTFPAITSADEVWLVTAGAEKAGAIGMALGGAGPVQVPAAGARGRHRTLWFLDRNAATEVPQTLRSLRT